MIFTRLLITILLSITLNHHAQMDDLWHFGVAESNNPTTGHPENSKSLIPQTLELMSLDDAKAAGIPQKNIITPEALAQALGVPSSMFENLQGAKLTLNLTLNPFWIEVSKMLGSAALSWFLDIFSESSKTIDFHKLLTQLMEEILIRMEAIIDQRFNEYEIDTLHYHIQSIVRNLRSFENTGSEQLLNQIIVDVNDALAYLESHFLAKEKTNKQLLTLCYETFLASLVVYAHQLKMKYEFDAGRYQKNPQRVRRSYGEIQEIKDFMQSFVQYTFIKKTPEHIITPKRIPTLAQAWAKWIPEYYSEVKEKGTFKESKKNNTYPSANPSSTIPLIFSPGSIIPQVNLPNIPMGQCFRHKDRECPATVFSFTRKFPVLTENVCCFQAFDITKEKYGNFITSVVKDIEKDYLIPMINHISSPFLKQQIFLAMIEDVFHGELKSQRKPNYYELKYFANKVKINQQAPEYTKYWEGNKSKIRSEISSIVEICNSNDLDYHCDAIETCPTSTNADYVCCPPEACPCIRPDQRNCCPCAKPGNKPLCCENFEN